MERWVVGVSKLCTITRIPTNSFNRLLKLFFFYLHATMDGYKVWLEWHDKEQQFGCCLHQRLKQIHAIHQDVSCFSFVNYYSEKGSNPWIRGPLTQSAIMTCTLTYRIVASASQSYFKAHVGLLWLLMKGILTLMYLLWPFDKKLIF